MCLVSFTLKRGRMCSCNFGGIGRHAHSFWCSKCHAMRFCTVGLRGIGWRACQAALIVTRHLRQERPDEDSHLGLILQDRENAAMSVAMGSPAALPGSPRPIRDPEAHPFFPRT